MNNPARQGIPYRLGPAIIHNDYFNLWPESLHKRTQHLSFWLLQLIITFFPAFIHPLIPLLFKLYSIFQCVIAGTTHSESTPLCSTSPCSWPWRPLYPLLLQHLPTPFKSVPRLSADNMIQSRQVATSSTKTSGVRPAAPAHSARHSTLRPGAPSPGPQAGVGPEGQIRSKAMPMLFYNSRALR